MEVQPEVQTPYWQLEEDRKEISGLQSLTQRLSMAVRPVVEIVRRAALAPSIAVLVAQCLNGVVTAAVLLLTTRVLQELLENAPIPARLHHAAPDLLLLCGAQLFHMALEAVTSLAKARVAPKVRRAAEDKLIGASLGVDLASFDEPGFYDQLSRARDRGIQHFESATTQLVDVISAAFSVAGAAAAVFLLQPLLLPLLIVALLPTGWAAVEGARLQYAALARTIALTRQTRIVAELATQRQSAAEIRANQAQDYVASEYAQCAAELETHLVKQGVVEAKCAFHGSLLSGLGVLATFAALGAMFCARMLDLAVAGTAIIAVRTASAALTRLAQVSRELFEGGLYISDYRDFIDLAKKRSRVTGHLEAPATPGRIQLSNVGFVYPGSGRSAVHDISLSIEEGETVAFVGENGSGKTTLAKLMAGLYQPTSGLITWGGVDVRQISAISLADRISMVAQEPVRWPRSACDNVRVGRHQRIDPDGEVLDRVAGQSGIDGIVRKLPDGWATILSKQFIRGCDLSGGEWQRLAVARGLYRDSPLVIWDEPASSLDARAESLIYRSLRRLAEGRTVILITHRLASVREADRIFFLEQGRLVEQGTHEELCAAGGAYASLYRLQEALNGSEATVLRTGSAASCTAH